MTTTPHPTDALPLPELPTTSYLGDGNGYGYDSSDMYAYGLIVRREGYELAMRGQHALSKRLWDIAEGARTSGVDEPSVLAKRLEAIAEALASQPAQEQVNAQGKINAELDIHSNHAEPQQRRNMACALEMGQPMGDGQDSLSGDIEPQGTQSLERWLYGILKPLAEDIAKNCSTAPQLVIAPLIWGIGDLLKSGVLYTSPPPKSDEAQEQAGAVVESPLANALRKLLVRTEGDFYPVEQELARAALDLHDEAFKKECDDADELLRLFGLDPESCRTDGGFINMPRVRSLLIDRNPHGVLSELLECFDLPYPPETAGRDAQSAWGDRRAAAKEQARSILALKAGGVA